MKLVYCVTFELGAILPFAKKILYVSPNGYLGGAERFVLTAVKAHAQAGNLDAAILFFSDGQACQEAKRAGLNCFTLTTAFRFRSPWKLFRALREIRAIVKKYEPDILHLTMPYSFIALSLATIGLDVKKVWFQHGPVGGLLDKIGNLFPADMILYNSLYLRDTHHQAWPPVRNKVQESIINIGIESFPVEHRTLGSSPIILGTAGRICSWKGFHNILRSLGELKKHDELKPFKLRIAGDAKTPQDQSYVKELTDLVAVLGLSDAVEFLGHTGKMGEFYQSLDIFIHSSIIPEPFGLVAAEAMANGCLVIASDTGGVSDFVKNEVTGLSYSSTGPNAVIELKEQLSVFLSPKLSLNMQKYQLIAEYGKRYVQDRYSISQMVEQLESQYLKL